jgi:hypothetical protein
MTFNVSYLKKTERKLFKTRQCRCKLGVGDSITHFLYRRNFSRMGSSVLEDVCRYLLQDYFQKCCHFYLVTRLKPVMVGPD